MYYRDSTERNLADGNFTSDSVVLPGSKVMATAVLEGIVVNDIRLKIEQSIDQVNWGVVPDSEVIITSGQTSQHWNIIGLVRESHLRLSGDKGSAVSGKLTGFKVLSPNE